MKTKIIYILIVLLMTSLEIEAQCAMCRAVLESEEGQEAAKGINNGIVYLMIIPYILIAVVGYFVYRNKKRPRVSEKR